MHSLTGLLAQLSLLCAATAAALPRRSTSNPKVLYLMTNDETENSIRALPIDSDGHLCHGNAYMTGGKGSRAPSTMLIDALASQGALAVIGDKLLAVNAGSNTLSMFAINQQAPENIKMVGNPISTLGDWPNTLAVSEKIPGLVCVANSGTKSGVACFKMGSSGLMPTDNTLHPLPLDPVATNPPQGPFNTVSQILFNADGTQLIAMVKGTPGSNNTGYVGTFAMENGAIAGNLAQSSPQGSLVLFGSVAMADNKVFATDASFGALTLQISPAGEATTLHKYVISTNAATCWATISPATGLAYVTDDGANTLVAIDPLSSSTTPLANTLIQNRNAAMTDIVPGGNWLYALSHGNSTYPAAITVMELQGSSGKVVQIQNFFPDKVTDNVEGLAIYPS